MKFTNKSPRLLQFSLGANDYAVRPGGQVTIPAEHVEHSYISGLVATGVLEEKPDPATTVQIEDNLSSRAGTTSEAPASTAQKAAPAKTSGK